MRATQIGTAIAAVTVLTLGGITAYRGNSEAVSQETRESQEQMRAKNQVTIAREIIANDKQYPSYALSPQLKALLPDEMERPRLNSFRSSSTGLYYFIAEDNGHWRVMGIYSAKEIQTAIDLLQKEQRNEIR